MSGINHRTGYFELTWTKAHWRSRAVRPYLQADDMGQIAAVLARAGLQVVRVHERYIEVDSTRDAVYRALSRPGIHWRS